MSSFGSYLHLAALILSLTFAFFFFNSLVGQHNFKEVYESTGVRKTVRKG